MYISTNLSSSYDAAVVNTFAFQLQYSLFSVEIETITKVPCRVNGDLGLLCVGALRRVAGICICSLFKCVRKGRSINTS